MLREMARGLAELSALPRVEVDVPRLTPLAFPIWAERVQARVSTESWRDRVQRMSMRLERAWEREEERGNG